MGKRRKFSSEFKHRIVIESLKERLTLSEPGQKYDLHPNVITSWKNEFIEKNKDVFEKPGKKRDHQLKEDELYKEIGKLEVENGFHTMTPTIGTRRMKKILENRGFKVGRHHERTLNAN